MLQLLQLYFTIITLEVYTEGVKRHCVLLLILHKKMSHIQLLFILFTQKNENNR